MLVGIYGDVGSGKTVLLSEIGLLNPDKLIKANFHLELPNYEPLQPEELLSLEPSEKGTLVLITEAYTWLESRVSMSKLNRYMSYVGFQSRKRDLDIVCDAQLRSSLDLRFKDMENYTVFAFDRPNPKTSTEDFVYRVIKGIRYKDLVFPYNKAKKLWSKKWGKDHNRELFDTMQVIMPPDIEELKAEMITSNPVSLNKAVNNLIIVIKNTFPQVFKKELKEITHDFVSDLLLQIGKPVTFESFVYIRLRSQLQQQKEKQ